jgi:hypothetical protein
MEFDTQKQTFAVMVGTTVATIFGPVPPQDTAAIYRAKYINPAVGTPGTFPVTGYLMAAPGNAGYSTMGTISPNGSIVDAGIVANGMESGAGLDGSDVIAVVPPGYYLVALATAGSLLITGLYTYRLGRST